MSFKQLAWAFFGVLSFCFFCLYLYYKPEEQKVVHLVGDTARAPHASGWFFFDTKGRETRASVDRHEEGYTFYLSGNKILKWKTHDLCSEGELFWGQKFQKTFHLKQVEESNRHVRYEGCECAIVFYKPLQTVLR